MTLTGANVPFGKMVALELPVYIFLALRFAIAALTLHLMMQFEHGPPLRKTASRYIGSLVVMSLFGSVLFTAFLLEGTKRTSATNAGIIMATLPAVSVLIGALWLRRTPTLLQLAIVGLAVLGLASVQTAGDTQQTGTQIGNFLVIIAVFLRSGLCCLFSDNQRRDQAHPFGFCSFSPQPRFCNPPRISGTGTF